MSTNSGQKHTYEYPRPALTVDVAIVTREARPRVLLIRRKKDPFAGSWALPGGFVDENERLADAARRELVEETGVTAADLEQLYTSGDPAEIRGWVVSVVYLAQVDFTSVKPVASTMRAGLARARRAALTCLRPRDAPQPRACGCGMKTD